MLSNLWSGLFYFWFAAETVIAFATRSKQSSAKVRDRGSQVILWVVIVVSITACEGLRHILPPNIFGGAHWVRSAGMILLAAGLLIRCVAILTLGKSFQRKRGHSRVAEDQKDRTIPLRPPSILPRIGHHLSCDRSSFVQLDMPRDRISANHRCIALPDAHRGNRFAGSVRR